MERRMVVRGSLVACVLLLLVPGGDRQACAEDAELARFLFDGGVKAVKKRSYEDGITRLEKALAEDPELFEAHYWIGYALDKLGNTCAAVSSYRAFRDACQGCDEKLDRSLSRLLRKVLSRLKVLAAAECELTGLNEDFVKDALALARKHFVRDPDLARRAVEAVFVLDPANEEARKLCEKLGGEPGADAEAADSTGGGPTKDVDTWRDLLADGVFGENSDWTYANGRLEIDHEPGRFVSPPRTYESPKAFVYEIEGRILQEHGKWALGVMFGKHGSAWYACHLARTELVLWHVQDVTRRLQRDIVELPRAAFPTNTWFRLSVAVKGNRVEVFLNGKKEISHVVKGVRDFQGDIGIFNQSCHSEIRTLRIGAR